MNKKLIAFVIAIWVISLIYFILEIVFRFSVPGMNEVINYLYVSVLIVYLLPRNILVEKTRNVENLVRFKGYDVWGVLVVIALITALLLFIGFKSSVIVVMSGFTFLLSIWITVKYFKWITRSLIIKGLIFGLICCLPLYHYIPSLVVIFLSVPFFFVSGSLLNSKFSITTIHINTSAFYRVVKSFFAGCLFGLPMALSNLADVIATNPYQWIEQFWKISLVFNMVLLEEIWVRLFILTFVYALVSSKTRRKIIPIVASILISSVLFGFTHYPNIDIQNCFDIMILYGFPLGVLFYRRNFEAAVGYHFIINFVGAIATLV